MLRIFSCTYWPSICLLWRNVYLGLLSIFWLGGLFFVFCILLILSCTSNLYILEIKPLSVTSFANIFSHSVSCLFVLFMVSFAMQKLLSLIRSHLFSFAFVSITLGVRSKKYCYKLYQSVLSMFSSGNFIVFGLTFNLLIYFEFIFVYGVRECSNFILSL